MKTRQTDLLRFIKPTGICPRLSGLFAYAALSDKFSRMGCRWYGLMLNQSPLIAGFVDDSWYNPATSFGLAIGRFELGIFASFKSSTSAGSES